MQVIQELGTNCIKKLKKKKKLKICSTSED
jgi:hypothetical protein